MAGISLKITEENDKKYCKRCHRELKSDESKRLGYGKTCYARINRHQSLYLFEVEDSKCLDTKKKKSVIKGWMSLI